MSRRALFTFCLGLLMTLSVSHAITPSNDLLIAGAARTSRWVSDLYINNPGSSTVLVEVFWLERGQANPSPTSQTFSIAGDSTLILNDVLLEDFDLPHAEGAFRITADGMVTANLIVVAGTGEPDGTFGSGFEAIPASSATRAGQTSNIMGLVDDGDFYTNIFALAGAAGATMEIDLLAPNGSLLDTGSLTLEAYEPWHSAEEPLWDIASYDNATAQVRVSAGSAVVLGSKIDETSEDPTTLESAFGSGAVSPDGTYQFAVYDSLSFASGGNLVVADATVEVINGTYINFDKVDGQGNSECTLIFQWGIAFNPTAVDDFASGVDFTDSYPDGGDMTWTVTFTIEDNIGLAGTVAAVGANFSGQDSGCNGSFPTQLLEGGKSN